MLATDTYDSTNKINSLENIRLTQEHLNLFNTGTFSLSQNMLLIVFDNKKHVL